MAKNLEIHTSLKFRKSVFSLLGDFMKLALVVGMLSFLVNIASDNTGIIFFLLCMIIGMSYLCLMWHYNVVKVKGNILEIQKGFIFQQKKSFSMEYIQEIKVNQSIVGRQLKYGDLVITAPTIDSAIVIRSLDSVWRLYKILNDYAREQENEGFVITT